MTDDNQKKTIATYEQGFDDYLTKTPSEVSGEFKDYLDSFLTHLDKDSEILEIGSGTGRDAAYMKNLGYTVLCSDLPQVFISHLQKKHEVVSFNALETDLGRRFEGVVATAVFLHFTKEQLEVAIKNVKRHLKPEGVFALALKKGKGEEISHHKMNGPRYFKYWAIEELENALSGAGFEMLSMSQTKDDKWIHAIAKLKNAIN